MGETAVRAMRAAGYNNAGTVEFLLDKDRKFYFLEVNARLQVEHPVTELVTGVDLVRQQILIAAGRDARLRPGGPQPERARHRMPDLRRGSGQRFPALARENPASRRAEGSGRPLDSGIYAGWDVPIYYDPILAKLIVWAEDREPACRRMAAALDDYVVLGIRTTIGFLKDVISHPDVPGGTDGHGLHPEVFRGLVGEGGRRGDDGSGLAAAAFADMNGLGRRSAGAIADAPAKAAADSLAVAGPVADGGE